MELTYKSQRLRTGTQAPGGAPIAKIISGSSQSQVKIQNKVQNTVLNESTAIVPDTQNQTVKPLESKNVPKTGQSESVIQDSDELEESSSENQTGLTRMSQEGFQDLISGLVRIMIFITGPPRNFLVRGSHFG